MRPLESLAFSTERGIPFSAAARMAGLPEMDELLRLPKLVLESPQ